MGKHGWLAAMAIGMSACAGSSAAGGGAESNSDAATDSPSLDAASRSSGTRSIEGCANLGIGSEPCSFTFVWDPSTCANRSCKRLVIYFSGGQESCPDVTDTRSYLAYYKAQGYVGVCAMAFQTPTGSAEFPRHLEAARFNLLVQSITSDPDVLAGWSGEHLMFSGVSHGGSGPVVTMATHDYDDQSSWKGSKYTGACFYDGAYDVSALLDFHFTNQCREATAVVSYQRTFSRYCPWPASANGDLVVTWPPPATCSNADTAADTVTAASAAALAVHDWKLVECGSALSPCLQDVLPAPPIRTLCDGIAATPGYTCAFGSFSNVSHILCGIEPGSLPTCHDWFESQLSARGLR